MFCNRVELLPEDETIREHEQGKEAEAKVLADDKKGPGLFKGRFKRRRPPFLGLPRVLRDAADGVERCPSCMWELEEGMCNQCGWPQHSDNTDSDSDESIDDHMVSFEDYDSDDDDRDISPVDQFGGPIDIPHIPAFPAFPALPHGYRPGAFSDQGSDVTGRQSPDYYSLDEDEHDSEMEGFIDDADYPEEVDHDDDGSVHTVNTYNPTSPAAQYSTDNGGVTTDYDEDEDEPVQMHRPVYGRRQTPIEIDAEPDSDSESETTTQATNDDNDTASEMQTVDDNSIDSDDSSVREISPPTALARIRKRRVVESEDESSSDDSESDDTAIRAPQPAAARRRRLDARRASNTLQAARRVSRSPSPQQRSTSSSSWARRGGGNGVFRGRGVGSIPRRGQPYTRVH